MLAESDQSRVFEESFSQKQIAAKPIFDMIHENSGGIDALKAKWGAENAALIVSMRAADQVHFACPSLLG